MIDDIIFVVVLLLFYCLYYMVLVKKAMAMERGRPDIGPPLLTIETVPNSPSSTNRGEPEEETRQ